MSAPHPHLGDGLQARIGLTFPRKMYSSPEPCPTRTQGVDCNKRLTSLEEAYWSARGITVRPYGPTTCLHPASSIFFPT
jgi:hypothetical protein